MSRFFPIMALCLAVSTLFACSGEQFAHSVSGKMTPTGKWTIDQTLYRGYQVSLEEGYDAAVKYAQNIGTVKKQLSDVDWARVEAVYMEGELERRMRISIIQSEGAALDIGVNVDDGDRVASGKILDDMEKYIPGRRVYPMSSSPAADTALEPDQPQPSVDELEGAIE